MPTLSACGYAFDHMKDIFGYAFCIFLTSDGEEIILSNVFFDVVMKAFADANIDYFKLPPSATSVHQVADVADTFRDTKTGIRHTTKTGTDTVDDHHMNSMKNTFAEFKLKFPTFNISNDHRVKIAEGVCKISFVLRNKYHTMQKMQLGFIRCGQHVPHTKPGELTVNYELMMSKCTKVCIAEELAVMRECKQIVVDEFRLNGHVSSAFPDGLQIANDPADTVRDNLGLARRDCFLVTHAASKSWYDEYTRRRRAVTDPILIALNKRIAAATKRVEKKLKSDRAKAERARLAQEKKDRHAGMTKPAIAKERADEAKERKRIKDEKAAKAMAAFESDCDLLEVDEMATIVARVNGATEAELAAVLEEEAAPEEQQEE